MAAAGAGDLDPTFGNAGKVISESFGFGHHDARGVLVQPDGKIVVTGSVASGVVPSGTFGSSTVFGLTRYNTDGSLDLTFGTDGIVTTSISDARSSGNASAALQPDGKIVVVGGGGGTGFLVLRYNADGALDDSFDGDGKVLVVVGNPSGSARGFADAVALQSDGKIVVVGIGIVGTESVIGVARLNIDGSLDASFGSGGKATTKPAGASFISAYAVAIGVDGKIIVAGDVFSTSTSDFMVIRYDTNGSLDGTFGAGGIVTTGFTSGGFESAFAVTVQPDGKIIAAGTGQSGFNLARYNVNGSLDTTFDFDGSASFSFSSFPTYAPAYAVTLQPDGKILVAGRALNNFAVARLKPNGALDPSFSYDGKTMTNFVAGSDTARAIALQPDGKIVVAGSSAVDETSPSAFALTRYNPDGSLDTTLDGDGKLTTLFARSADTLSGAALQPDGKLVAVGTTSNGNSDKFALARYNPDGSLDTSFGIEGKVATRVRGYDSFGYAVAVQSDGKIVVVGAARTPSNFIIALARYHSDGKLDTDFGDDGVQTSFIGNSVAIAYAMVIQPDAKIIIAGRAQNTTNSEFLVARYNPDGSFDNSFDSDGIVTTDFDGGFEDAYAVSLRADGRIIVGGTTNNAGVKSFAVASYNQDGSLDGTFDVDGKNTTRIGTSSNSVVYGISAQPDGGVVAVGTSIGTGTNSDFLIARYGADGRLDSEFGDAGISNVEFTDNDSGYAVSLAEDGKIIAAGSSASDFGVARYNTNGTPDNTFSGNGILTTDFVNSRDTARAIVAQPDGKIIVAGTSVVTGTNPSSFAFARYLTVGDVTTTTRLPLADTYVQGATTSRDTNYGLSAEMQVKRTFNAGAGRGRRAFLKFDISDINTAVTSVRLRIYAKLSDASLSNVPMIVQKVTDTTWDEFTMTWNNQPPTASPDALAQITVISDSGQYYEFDLTQFIQQERAAGRNVVSLRLINQSPTGNSGAFFTSVNTKEAEANRPQLIIEQ
jgi:uncharacterized delta-60 repeat protein